MTPILDRVRAHGGEVLRDRWTFRIRRGRLTEAALDWLRLPEVKDRLAAEVWPDWERWNERAAIREFDGGQDRAVAEAEAYREIAGC